MKGGIDPDARLDYVELQIFPSQNRYEVYVCSRNKVEKAASGALKQLLLHSPRVKDLSSKGSNTNFKVLPPDNVNDAEWFTTATLTRFLHILDSPDILSIGIEITQLEETRKFQLSLSLKALVDIASSVDSKNELLRAVDLRITALKDEVVAAFYQVTSARCSTKDISDLENFAHHFGAKDIRDVLQKFVEMSIFPTVEDTKKSIRHDVSPKLAQIEQHNSTDVENSSFSSEEDQPSINRRRAASRSATPRRSASPMRRIQIGRSGSHRTPALTIKSLNHFPIRDKILFQRDPAGNSSDEDDNDPDNPTKKNILRMSVQDKISLFESKQRDQKADLPKAKKLLNRNVGPNKAVLRRWSSGMGENATQIPKHSPPSPNNIATESQPELDPEAKPGPKCDGVILESRVSNVTAENINPHSPEREESYEKHPDSIEWTQQNEAKLNELFMKMMEDKNKPVRHPNPNSGVTKSKKSTVLKEERSASCDQYEQKREAFGKKAEKNTEMASTNVNKPLKEKTQKNSSPLLNSRKEPLKPSVLKKTATKPSSLPATRKSWSSAPSPRTPTGPASATTTPTSRKPVGSNTKSEKSQPRSKTLKSTPPDAGRNLKNTNQKTQSTVTKSTKTTKTKVQTPDPEVKPSVYNKVTKKSSVVPLEPKPFLRKGSGIGPGVGPVVIKSKVVDQPEETSETLIHTEDNEVVMALDTSENEEKCEPQVGSLSPSPSPGPTKCEESMSSTLELSEVVDLPEETSRTLIHTEDNEEVMVRDISENNEICEPQVVSLSPSPSPSPNPCPTTCEESMSSSLELSEITNEKKEELMISPTAWVEDGADESDNNHEEEMIPCLVQSESPVKLVPAGKSSSPRVRHSLSQMLLEESCEEATDVSEWGNAEHPPSLIYQKDPPKGFKRLLKFTRRSKAESALSEADDDAGESTVTSQNHLKVPEGHVSASLNTSKGTRSFFSLSAFRVSKTNESKLP